MDEERHIRLNKYRLVVKKLPILKVSFSGKQKIDFVYTTVHISCWEEFIKPLVEESALDLTLINRVPR